MAQVTQFKLHFCQIMEYVLRIMVVVFLMVNTLRVAVYCRHALELQILVVNLTMQQANLDIIQVAANMAQAVKL